MLSSFLQRVQHEADANDMRLSVIMQGLNFNEPFCQTLATLVYVDRVYAGPLTVL